MRPIPLFALSNLITTQSHHRELVHGFAIDSRKVSPGDLFFALPGFKVDGHQFLREAAAKGAVGAIVQEGFRGDSGGLSLVHVPNVLIALQELARKILAERATKVIAITGSLGKTTTKEFAKALLQTHYKVFSSPLSYNSQSTVPLSVLMADGDEELLILEMGMSHEGNIQKLISIAPPDIALITTVAVQHAVNFSDGLAGISKEKSSVLSHPKTVLGLIDHDIPHYSRVASVGNCIKKTFSLQSREADYFLESIAQGVRVYAKGEDPCDCVLNLSIPIHYHNFLAAVSLARNLNIPWSSIQEVAPTLRLPPMRFEPIEKQGILFINDAYNANPDAMVAALKHLPKPRLGGKTIAVLSEMDALGEYTVQGHAAVAQAALEHVDHLLCIGSAWTNQKSLWEGTQKHVELFKTHSELGASLKKKAKAGDVVFLKGARSYALDQLLHDW